MQCISMFNIQWSSKCILASLFCCQCGQFIKVWPVCLYTILYYPPTWREQSAISHICNLFVKALFEISKKHFKEAERTKIEVLDINFPETFIWLFFVFPACLWFPALGCGNSRWQTVHLRQWWIWPSGSKVNIQQDAARKGGCPRGISCGTGKKWTVLFVFIPKQMMISLPSETR